MLKLVLNLLLAFVCGDLIGYNRLGNNVFSHYRRRLGWEIPTESKPTEPNYLLDILQQMDLSDARKVNLQIQLQKRWNARLRH